MIAESRLSAAPLQPQIAVDALGLTVEFDGRILLDNVNLSLMTGQVTWLLGANGAGKTTLLRCLAGLQRPTSGTVRWFGQSPLRNAGIRSLIGMVTHRSLLYPELTSRENLLFAARMCEVLEPQVRVERLLVEAGLQCCAHQSTSRLSHGWRKRVSIARALVHEPSILLLDEPYSGLDEEGRNWLEGFLESSCNRRAAICVTTHEYRRMTCPADRVFELSFGELKDRVAPATNSQVREHHWSDAA
jgi:heme exporter protein A